MPVKIYQFSLALYLAAACLYLTGTVNSIGSNF